MALLYNQQLFVTTVIADCRDAVRSVYKRTAENRVLEPDTYSKYHNRSLLIKNYGIPLLCKNASYTLFHGQFQTSFNIVQQS